MGCGVSKLSIPSSTGEVADNHLENGRASALNEPDQGNITAGHKSPETHSTRPSTPRSTDSGDKHSSCSDNESDVRQVSPIRIRADSGRDALPNLSPAVAEMKKGFVAFDIPLNDSQNVEMDNILKKPLPRRLRRLEPLGNAPLITTEMLMEKLEKAEAKRRKALSRRRTQSARWREVALRRSEHMGDTCTTLQPSEDLEDSEKLEDNGTSDKLDPDLLTGIGNENTNWDVRGITYTATKSPQPNMSEGSETSSNKNNNSLSGHFAYTMENILSSPNAVRPPLYSYSTNVQIPAIEMTQFPSRCHLQIVHEEEFESDDSGTEDSHAASQIEFGIQKQNVKKLCD